VLLYYFYCTTRVCGPVVVVVGISVLMVGVPFVVAVYFCVELMSNVSWFSVTHGCCNVFDTAPPTTFTKISDVAVASDVCGGVARFLDEFQKTCVTYLIVVQWVVSRPEQHLHVDVVSRLQ
jgi:hypothetical protein